MFLSQETTTYKASAPFETVFTGGQYGIGAGAKLLNNICRYNVYLVF